jgi:arylsulfatase A-like enzyme
MPLRHALVIAVDGLRASALGCYGNTWHATPALDVLAAQSIVHDWMWINSPLLSDFYRCAWRDGQPLLEVLAAAGVATALTTDDAALADAEAAGFAEICRLETAANDLAATPSETALACLFALLAQQVRAAAATIAAHPETAAPRLWWLHARGFHGPWDAPLELRQSLLEETDPPAPTFVDPPRRPNVADHDQLLLDRAAYAAQTMVLGECIGALLDALAESGLDKDTLVVLIGCRGYALGEHSQVGGDALYSELLHVPYLVRVPGGEAPRPRSARFVGPSDLSDTLLDWFGLKHEAAPAREFVAAVSSNGERSIRTAAWMLRQPPHAEDENSTPLVELYAKPDDRWEANEIADRAADVAARLAAVLENWRATACRGDHLPQLDADLISPER